MRLHVRLQRTHITTQRRWISDARPFVADDLVLLRQTNDPSAPPILTRPLKPGRRIESHRGILYHDSIIGKRVRDVVRTSTPKSPSAGTEFILHDVTLEEYARLSRRLVTPIYGADANLIVSLLDLHPGDHEDVESAQLEILEAGTGHGALTLYLSRATHASNCGIPALENDPDDALDAWKARRRAVVHTIDVSPRFSEHAQGVVQAFRHGQYANNVDFHVGDVSRWVDNALTARNSSAFLSHAFLDLPGADSHLETVAKALRVDGKLIVFNPSITQILACATRIKDDRIPLHLAKVVELGVNGGSGGREWDLRFVRPRAQAKGDKADGSNGKEAHVSGDESESGAKPEMAASEGLREHTGWSTVCRPLVGERIVGGGFLGVWHKRREGITGEE